METTEGAAVV